KANATTTTTTRKRHNLVEQQYRQRLNSQFKQLLDILPGSPDSPGTSPTGVGNRGGGGGGGVKLPPILHHPHGHGQINGASQSQAHERDRPRAFDLNSGSGGGSSSGVEEKRVSKGEVLDRARVYIQALEREHKRLVAERRELDLRWEGAGAGRWRGREVRG
ncbi:hypothetical protein C8A05DRAFT_18582, partial [Staphylotrichum tortipilum]